MRTSKIERVAKKIIQQSERGESTVIFLGAGASVSSGIPTALKLIDYIKSEENLNTFINPNSSKYFEIMGDLDSGDRQRILNYFIDKSKINITHLIIAVLMKIGLIDCIVTTNFDPLTKRALSLLNCKNQVYDIANNVSLAGFNLSFPSVIYLHGEYQNVWQFNTKAELKKKSSEIRSIIDKIGTHRSWIIVGYSGNDFVFDQLSKLEKFNEGLFWIGFNNEEPIEKVKNGLLSKPEKNTYHISGYDSDSFFKKLLTEIQSLKSLKLGEALEKLQLSFKNHDQFEARLKVTSASNFELSEACEKWIDKKILEESLQSTQEGTHVSIWKKLLDKFSSIFKDRQYYQIEEYIRNNKPSEAIFAINKLQENGIDGYISHYYKGAALGLQAQAIENPEESLLHYRQMEEAFSKARALANRTESAPGEIGRIDKVRESLWREEHNKAVEFASDDSIMQSKANPLEVSIAHLKNALYLKPDASLSLSVYAQVNGMAGNYEEAAKAQKKYIDLKDSKSAKSYMLLAQYYRNDNQPQKAISVLENTREKYPDNTQIVEILADSYSQAGESEKAINTVSYLIEQDPTNPQYQLSLGTQLYQSALNIQEEYDRNANKIFDLQEKLNKNDDLQQSLKSTIQELRDKNEKLVDQINRLTDQSIKHLNECLKNRPNEPISYNTLGIIFQNKASVLFEQRNTAPNIKQAAKYDKHAKQQLYKSMKYYEKAAEMDKADNKYWRSLFKVYKALGMEEKTKEAQKKVKQL
jgi:predicted Zn-dependent protease